MKKGEMRRVVIHNDSKERINFSGVVNPLNGDLYVKNILYGNSATFIDLLVDLESVFSKYKKIYLYVDGATFHRSAEIYEHILTQKYTKVELCRLPRYSPNKNPIERLWKKLKQDHKNIMFKTKKTCVTQIIQYFKELNNDKIKVMSLCHI